MWKALIVLLATGVLVAQTTEQTGVIAGRIVRPNGQTASNVEVEALRLEIHNAETRLIRAGVNIHSDDRGQFRISAPPGDYYVRTMNEQAPNYGNTYFPGTLNFQGATPIRLQKGAEVSGINFVHLGGKLHYVGGVFSGVASSPWLK